MTLVPATGIEVTNPCFSREWGFSRHAEAVALAWNGTAPIVLDLDATTPGPGFFGLCIVDGVFTNFPELMI